MICWKTGKTRYRKSMNTIFVREKYIRIYKKLSKTPKKGIP